MAMALQTRDVTIGYRRRRQPDIVLASQLNLRLRPGTLVGLLGVNGVGKSTLLRTLAGTQAPLAGSVLLAGRDLRRLGAGDLARRLSMVLTRSPSAVAMTGFELVALGRLPHTDWLGKLRADDRRMVAWALEAVDARDLANESVAELSDGQRQKLMIARALAQETEVMLLDEPTAFLDLPRRIETMQLLKALAHDTSRAILAATHELDLALRHCDALWLMSGRGIQVGEPAQLAGDGSISRAFGMAIAASG